MLLMIYNLKIIDKSIIDQRLSMTDFKIMEKKMKNLKKNLKHSKKSKNSICNAVLYALISKLSDKKEFITKIKLKILSVEKLLNL